MPFAEDIVTLLAGVSPVVYISSKTQIPEGGPHLSVVETGGSGPDYIQNQTAPAYRKPSAQLTARGVSYPAARTLALAAWSVLAAIRNQTVNGTFYRSIKPLQEPFDIGDDDKSRPTVKFNVIAE